MRSAIVLGCLVAMTGAARADGISWVAPEGCPAPDVVVAGVVANLGRPLVDGEVDAQLTVTRHGRRWKVSMTVDTATGDGERTLEGASCRDLADSAALIVALAIDPMAGLPPAAPPAPPPPPPPPEVEIAEAASPEPEHDDEVPPVANLTRRHVDISEDEPHVPLPIAVRVRASVGGDLGSLPGAASGWAAGATLAFGPWSLDATVARFAEQRAMVPSSMTEGAIIGLTSLDARGCYTGGRWYRAGGCVGADLAFTRSEGFGFTNPTHQTSTGGGVQVAATWAVRLFGPFAARADIDATWQIVRAVLVDGAGAVIHDPDILVWRGFAGVEASWR